MGGFTAAAEEMMRSPGEGAENAPPPEKAGEKDAGKKGEPDKSTASEIRELREQLHQREQLLREVSASERHWHGQATAVARKQEAEPDDDLGVEVEDVPDVDPDKLIDELAANGTKALKKYGFITKKEALEMARSVAEKVSTRTSKELIGKTRDSLTRDAELIQKYPDLQKQDSALFAKTREIFRATVERNPDAAKDGGALMDAAEKASLMLEIEALKSKRSGDSDDRDTRILAQGDRGRRGGESFQSEDDDRMSPRQKAIAAAMGVSDEDYMKTARGGINVSRRTSIGGRR